MKRRVTIHPHGSLRRIFSEPITIMARTAHEAVEMLTSQLPGFQPTAQGYKHVRLEGFPTLASLHDDLQVDELHLYPQMSGGKNGGFTQILIGAALMAVAFIAAPFTAGMSLGAAFGAMAAGAGTFGTMITTSLFMMGASTMIGGLVSLIMPQPTLSPGSQQEASKYLGAPSSTTKIGTTIRVIYGLRRVGFHYLSFGTNARNYVPST